MLIQSFYVAKSQRSENVGTEHKSDTRVAHKLQPQGGLRSSCYICLALKKKKKEDWIY